MFSVKLDKSLAQSELQRALEEVLSLNIAMFVFPSYLAGLTVHDDGLTIAAEPEKQRRLFLMDSFMLADMRQVVRCFSRLPTVTS